MQTSKSYKIGLLALCSFAILYYGFLFLQGRNVFSKHNQYRISYPVNRNLTVSAPVRLKGHAVGIITKIEIVPKNNYSTLVTIELDKKIPLTTQSKVMLNSTNVLEGNVLELELHEGKPLPPNSVIIGQVHPDFKEVDIQAVTSQVSVITSNLIKITEGMDEVLSNLKRASHTFTVAVNEVQYDVNAIVRNVATVSHSLADQHTGVPALLPAMHQTLAQMNAMPLKDFSRSLKRILHQTETLTYGLSRKQGTLGLLMQDPTLYLNLNRTIDQVNYLFSDVRRQPRRYVHFSLFGGSGKGARKVLPEKEAVPSCKETEDSLKLR